MYDKLPQTLKDHGAFCLWQYEKDRSGRLTKMPYQMNGMKASSTDRTTFTSFDDAASHMDGYSGIGLGVFDDLAAIDIDHCVVDGALSEMALDIIRIMDSYTEYSPSGTGVRILFRVRDIAYDKERYYINNRGIGLEVYVAGYTNRFVTVTGDAINGSDIEDRSDALMTVLDKYMVKPEKPASAISAPGSYLTDASVSPVEWDRPGGQIPQRSRCRPVLHAGFLVRRRYRADGSAVQAVRFVPGEVGAGGLPQRHAGEGCRAGHRLLPARGQNIGSGGL